MSDPNAPSEEGSPLPETRDVQSDRQAEPIEAEGAPRLAFPVVGIGASAGGLEAVSEMLSGMQAHCNMAFVLVQHLPPDRESLMPEILRKRVSLPVHQVEDGMAVEVNHFYVIRPGHVLTIRDGRLHLGPELGSTRAANRPVDDFFKSLAEEQRERAIAVILSGMGSNGTAGAQAVKAVGGLCIAQEPESAQFPSMPRNLIDSGNADYILRPGEMPDVLLAYAGHPYARGARETDSATALHFGQEQVRDILIVLRNRTRTDFSGYKKPTLLRRVQRRMGLARLTDMAEYVKFLRQSPGEVTALADDLLIHVTGFFRDPDAWEVLRHQVIVPLVKDRQPGDSIRCWVTACSTGDEAYTLAILLVEEAERAGKPLDIKVFATDMADRMVSQARAGVYPGGIEAEIRPERLDRYFSKEDAVYRIRPEMRERVVFAPQNILQDPPFSRIDIATCRNLLIYLEPEVQRRVLSLLHFGLRDGGTLFLGNSEAVSTDEGFEPIDKRARIFRRIGPTRHGAIDFPLPHWFVEASYSRSAGERAPESRLTGSPAKFAQITQRTLLEHHVQAAVLVDREYRVLFFQGNTSPFIEQPAGEPTRDLMLLAIEGVRSAIRAALRHAATENSPATVPDGWIEIAPGRRARITVTASPAVGSAGQFVISFDARADSPLNATGSDSLKPDDSKNTGEELSRLRDELQSANEELQTTNEEMRAAAEEASSVNEELQSTNEELETSKEEMLSLNEELNTVNAQLQAKMQEHQTTSNDLSSLLTSTDIAVLFLDTRLRIRRFTPAMRELIELLTSDAGRPLTDFALKFVDPSLTEDARLVLEKLTPLQREIPTDRGKWFIRRITPYRTVDDRIDGVVITFVDITARIRAAERLAETARLLDLSNDAIIVRDTDNHIIHWNRGASILFGWTVEEAMGKDLNGLLRTESEMPLDQLMAELRKRDRLTGEVVQYARDGTRKTLLCRWAQDRNKDGSAGSILTTATDISDRKRAEELVLLAREEAEAANATKDEFLATLSHELRTPLAAILLWSKILAGKGANAPGFEEGLSAIMQCAEAQKELIEDLLDTSRITSGKVQLQPKAVDLAALIHEAVNAVRPTAVARAVRLELQVDARIGTVSLDAERMRQVIWNLLSNAVKFTHPDGSVKVEANRKPRSIEIKVTDTGEGISPEFLPEVFTPFRQADGSSTRRHGGVGLGLAICQQLVHLHGGTIRAKSDGVGKGSMFTVSLPLPRATSAEDMSTAIGLATNGAEPAELSTDSRERLRDLRILIVEDDPHTRKALVLTTAAAGAKPIAVDSASAALQSITQAPPDLLLCDIGLPEKDGFALIRDIRAQERETLRKPLPAVALSAFTRDQDAKKSLDAGFQLYLHKPVDPLVLLTSLAKAVGLRTD
jgi:two-component system CheB/CheR fusion protein